MLDGHLERINAANHKTKSNYQATTSTHSLSYWEGPRPRDRDREEVTEMKEDGVVEPALTEEVSFIGKVPHMTAAFAVSSTTNCQTWLQKEILVPSLGWISASIL